MFLTFKVLGFLNAMKQTSHVWVYSPPPWLHASCFFKLCLNSKLAPHSAHGKGLGSTVFLLLAVTITAERDIVLEILCAFEMCVNRAAFLLEISGHGQQLIIMVSFSV